MVTRNFALLTASPKVPLKDLARAAAAVMRQINDHFFRFWGELGTVTPFADQSQVPLASCRITVVEGRPNVTGNPPASYTRPTTCAVPLATGSRRSAASTVAA